MKTRTSLILCALAVLALVAVQPAQAATYYWDDGTVIIDVISGGGTGTWQVGTAGWEDGASAQNWADGNAALFAGTGGTITLTGTPAPTSTNVDTTSGNYTFSGILGGGALTKSGIGTLTLSGANTFTGATDVQNGTLELTGSLSASTTLNIGNGLNSGKFILGGPAGAKSQAIAGLTSTGTGTANSIVGGNAAVSTLTVSVPTGITNTFAGTIGGSGANENNIYFVHSGAGGTLTLTGVNTFTGSFKLSLGTTPGVLSVSDIKDAGVPCNIGANTTVGSGAIALRGGTLRYTGDTATTNRGFRLSTASSTIDVSKDNATLTLGACELATLTLNVTGGSGSRLGLGATALTGAPTLNPTTANLTVASFSGTNNLILGGTSTDNRISGIIATGTGALTKSNTSTWTLSGANTYTGTTTVSAGTLLVNAPGSLAAGSTVTVGASGTLGGTGTIGGAVTINGILAPGTSVGTLTVNNATAINGTFSVEVETGGASDRLDVTGNLTLGGASILTIVNPGQLAASSYTIANYTGSLTGTFFDTTSLPVAWSVNYGTGSNSKITLTPEPATLALMALGGLGLILGRKRK